MSFFQNIWQKLTGVQENVADLAPETVPEEKSFRIVILEMLAAGMDHCSALVSLFLVELGETARKIRCKLVCLILGVLFLLVAYLFACGAAVVLLHQWMDWLYALLCVAGFHGVVGLILLIVAIKKAVGPFAPATVNEIKSDYECLRIAIKENRNC